MGQTYILSSSLVRRLCPAILVPILDIDWFIDRRAFDVGVL